MQKFLVLTPNEMQQLDQKTIEEQNITNLELMQRAGKALTDALFDKLHLEKASDKLLIVAGPGHNGGDG